MTKNIYILLFCLLSALVPILAVDVPRGLAFAPSIIGLVFYILYFLVFSAKPQFAKKALWLVLTVLGLSALSLTWAQDFDVSSEKVMKLSLLLPLQLLVISLAVSLKKETLDPYIHYFSYGIVITSLLLSFELLSGGLLFNAIRNVPLDTAVPPAEFNRASILLSLYSFIALTFLKARIKHRFYYLIILIPLFTALCLAESQSAQLSLVIGSIFLFFFPYRSKVAWQALKSIILISMISAVFVTTYVYQNFASDIQQAPMFAQAYAGHRLEIWDFVSRYALQQPLQGFGIEVTRSITDFDSARMFNNGNLVLHPHNFALQIWIEFGLLGILIAMAFIYKMLSMIQNNFTIQQQKILLPTAMAALTPAAFAFGMWQGWWIAVLFHLAAMSLIATKFTDDANTSKEVLNE